MKKMKNLSEICKRVLWITGIDKSNTFTVNGTKKKEKKKTEVTRTQQISNENKHSDIQATRIRDTNIVMIISMYENYL